jgi:VWFA-related protein
VTLLAALAILLAGSNGGAGQTRAQQPTFPSRVDAVVVDVVVFDRQGSPVENLSREDFTVREDGASQSITTFEAVAYRESAPSVSRRQRVSSNAARGDDSGRWFFVVFDDINISRFSTPRAREAMVAFLERVLLPGDRVLIAAASGGSSWTGTLPQDLENLKAFVQRLEGGRRPDTTPARIWDYEAMGITLGRDPQALAQVARRYFESGLIPEAYPTEREIREALQVSPGLALIQTRARQSYLEATVRIRTSLGVLERLAAALAQARGRKTLLLVSEGFVMDTTMRDFRDLVQAARTGNVAVHFVDVRSPDGGLGQPGLAGGAAEIARAVEERDATLTLAMAARESDGARSIAADTGGSVVSGTNLVAGLRRVAAGGRSYYLLGYSPSNSRRDGRFRKIDVVVNRPDVEVRARSGYFAPSNDDPPRPSPDTLDPAVRAALDAPFGVPGIPLRLASYLFGANADGTIQTLLLVEADPAPLRLLQFLGNYSAKLDSYVLIHDQRRNTLQRDERLVEIALPPTVFQQTLRTGLPIRREFRLAPGLYQATVLLRDRATGLVGSVRHELEVPPLGRFRISTPVLTDTIQAGAGSQQRAPVPIARRTFSAGSRLVSVFEVYGSARDRAAGTPRVSVGYSLRRPDGSEIAGAQPRLLEAEAAGSVPVTIGIALPEDARGEHELMITVRDDVTMTTIDDRETIVIMPKSG